MTRKSWLISLVAAVSATACTHRTGAPTSLAQCATTPRSPTPLYAAGNNYQADFERDRAEGCLVYGLAEWDRSHAPAAVLQRLHGLSGARCRQRAFGGFGWGLANRYVAQRDLQSAQGTLAAIDDVVLRWAACGGFWFVVDHTPDATMAPQHRTDALQQMAPLCRAPGTR